MSIQIFLYIEYKKFDCLFIEQPQCWTEHDALTTYREGYEEWSLLFLFKNKNFAKYGHI